MTEILMDTAQIDQRLEVVRANLTESIEQAAGYSGAADEELYAERIATYESELEKLVKQRDELIKKSSAHQA